jgi:hypothetical protein
VGFALLLLVVPDVRDAVNASAASAASLLITARVVRRRPPALPVAFSFNRTSAAAHQLTVS